MHTFAFLNFFASLNFFATILCSSRLIYVRVSLARGNNVDKVIMNLNLIDEILGMKQDPFRSLNWNYADSRG